MESYSAEGGSAVCSPRKCPSLGSYSLKHRTQWWSRSTLCFEEQCRPTSSQLRALSNWWLTVLLKSSFWLLVLISEIITACCVICNWPVGNLKVRSCDLLQPDSSTAMAGNQFRSCLGGQKRGRLMMWDPDSQRLAVFVAFQTTQQYLMFILNIQTLFFLWFKMDIVNSLFIAFNFFLALYNIPQRFLNYISFPTNFFCPILFHKRQQGFFLSPPLHLSVRPHLWFLSGLMYSFCGQFNHLIVLPLR